MTRSSGWTHRLDDCDHTLWESKDDWDCPTKCMHKHKTINYLSLSSQKIQDKKMLFLDLNRKREEEAVEINKGNF